MTLALAPTPSGPAWDETAPTVEIVNPSVAVVAFAAPYTFTVEVEANDEGSGVEEVALLVDGEPVGEPDFEAPYVFNVALEVGSWTLTAEARDHAGNVATSNAQAVRVIDEDDGSTGDLETSTSTGGEDPDDDEYDPGQGDGSSSGGDAAGPASQATRTNEAVGCTTGGPRSGWAWMLAVVVAGIRRRRG